MAGGFRILEEVALADVAYEAWGDSPQELFEWASQGLIETMVTPSSVTDSWRRDLHLEERDIQELLFEWLSQMVYVKDAEGVVFQTVHCHVWNDPQRDLWQVRGTLIGARIDSRTQELQSDVKAITRHLYEVKQQADRWVVTIVLDV